MANWSHRRERVQAVAAAVQAIAIVVAGIFAGYQYLAAREDDRVRAALAYTDRYFFEAGPVREARVALEMAWSMERARLREVTVSGDERRYVEYVLNAVAEHNLADDVREITRFFDAVGICIQENLCDAEVVESKLCYEARSFFRLHYVFLTRERELLSYPSYASATEQLANELCPSGR